MTAYPIGTVYSLAAGINAVPFDEMWAFADFISGRPIYNHELLTIHQAAIEYLDSVAPGISQFEWIGEKDWEGAAATIAALTEKYGATVEIEAGAIDWVLAGRSPLDTMLEIVPASKVVVVSSDDSPEEVARAVLNHPAIKGD